MNYPIPAIFNQNQWQYQSQPQYQNVQNVQNFNSNMLYDPNFAYYYSYYYNNAMNSQQVPQYSNNSNNSNFSWECKECEKKFGVASQYNAHVNTHVTCSFDGCEYNASKRLVLAHEYKVHSKPNASDNESDNEEDAVLKNLINFKPMSSNVESREEVEKWISDRRKNFPTSSKAKVMQTQKQQLVEKGGLEPPAYPQSHFAKPKRKSAQSVLQGYELSSAYKKVKRRPLLKLLLERERYNEKNIVFQCIRHILKT